MATGVVESHGGRGVPIRGPSALAGDHRRAITLTLALAKSDFKLRFFGSVLGYLWQLMRPLMLFGVLYVVFTIAGFTSGPHFPDSRCCCRRSTCATATSSRSGTSCCRSRSTRP